MSEHTPSYVSAIEAAAVAVATSDRATAERALLTAIHAVEALGPEDADLVLVLNDLIRLCLKHSSHALAEPLLLRLLDIKRSKGEEHPEFATVLASLAGVRQALGRHEEAEQLWRRVIAIREQTLAPNHFTLATAFEHLGEACAARGKFAEALKVSQRALGIREATLGRDHASLRSSRERIADLEMLAGEDILDPGASSSAPPKRSSVPTDSVDVGKAKVVSEKPALLLHSEPAHVEHQPRPSNPPAVAPRRPSPVPPPAALQRRAPAPVPAPVKPEAYLSVLEDLKDEIAVDQGKTPATVQSRMAAIALFLRRPKAAAIVGVGAITLPLAAWGVAGAARSSELNWVEQKTAVTALRPDTHAVGVGTGAGATTSAADRRKDSAATTAKMSGTAMRTVDATAKPATAEPLIRLEGTKRLNIALDSIGTQSRLPVPPVGSESMLRLSDANDLANAKSGAMGGAPQRARLIGALPTPRYPAQQLRGGAGGSVRVRFDVDTNGRPVMSTFGVVSSPLPQLSAAVKEVIPSIRFEPARTPWPESRAIVETVELTFHFAPPGK